jgi:hypothetical protein
VPSRRIAFSLLLPILSLALWVSLVAVPTTLSYISLLQSAHHVSVVTIQKGGFVTTVPHEHLFRFAAASATFRFAHFIEAINLPAFSIDLLISRFSSSWPSTWMPSGIPFESWRAIAYPFYCLPFWWFTGLGLDALLKRRHLHWPVLLLGTLLCSFFLFLFLGLRFGLSAEEREGMTYPFWGFGLWVVLLGIFPATWLRQKLASRRNLPQNSSFLH